MTTAEMIDALDVLERRVVRLVYFTGLSTTETACELGVDPREVTRILGRALRRVAAFVMDTTDARR